MPIIKRDAGVLEKSKGNVIKATESDDTLILDMTVNRHPEAGSFKYGKDVFLRGQVFDGLGGHDQLLVKASPSTLTSAANIKSLSAAFSSLHEGKQAFTLKLGAAAANFKQVESLRVMDHEQDVTGDVQLLSDSKTEAAIGEQGRQAKGVILFGDIDRGVHEVEVLDDTGLYGQLTASLVNDAADDGLGRVQWTYHLDKAVAQSLNQGDRPVESFQLRIRDADDHWRDVEIRIDVVGAGKGGSGLASAAIAGSVIDGYVSGATVFIDYNGNGVMDTALERQTKVITDQDGNYTVRATQPGGIIIATGGTNIDTGNPNLLVLKAPALLGTNNAVNRAITPLTTLVTEAARAIKGGTAPLDAQTLALAETRLKDALGLETVSRSLLTLDPVAVLNSPTASEADKAAALEVYKSGLQVALTVYTAQKLSDVPAEQQANAKSLSAALVSAIVSGNDLPLDDVSKLQALFASSGLLITPTLLNTLADASGRIAESLSLNDAATAQDQFETNYTLNVDEVAPTFSSLTTASAAENQNLLYTAAATDTDFNAPATAASVVYSLKQDGDAALLNIAANGQVTLKTGNLNFEGKSSYSFTVIATDAAGNASEQAVTLNVSNLDEVAPTFSSLTTASVSEGQSLLYTAAATDTDFNAPATAASVVYSLKQDGDAALLNIAANGQVTLKTGELNFEGKSSYSFTVIATDIAGNASEQAVTINVSNLDEAAPTFSSLTTASAAENQNLLYTAAATDTDFNAPATAASVVYSLKQGGDAALLNIAANGQVTLKTGELNFKGKSSYSFTVIATDAAGNASEQTVTTSVLDPNQAPTSKSFAIPNIGGQSYTFKVADFAFSDLDAGDTMSAIEIDSVVSSKGALLLNGAPVEYSNGKLLVTTQNIPKLSFVPSSENVTDMFLGFQVLDQAGAHSASFNAYLYSTFSKTTTLTGTLGGAATITSFSATPSGDSQPAVINTASSLSGFDQLMVLRTNLGVYDSARIDYLSLHLNSSTGAFKVMGAGYPMENTSNPFVTTFNVTQGGVERSFLVMGSSNGDNIVGTAFDDVLIGGRGGDVIDAGNGNDIIIGGLPGVFENVADTLMGGAGNDVFVYSAFGELLDGGQIVDSVSGGAGTDTVRLSAFIDNSVSFGAGESWARVSSVEVLDLLGPMSDNVSIALHANAFSGTGIRTISYEADTDNRGTNTLNASSQTDSGISLTLIGSAGNDSITAGAGADILRGGLGADTLNGGAGVDYFNLGANDGAADRVVDNGSVVSTVTNPLHGFSTLPVFTGFDIVDGFELARDKLQFSSSRANYLQGKYHEDTNTFVGDTRAEGGVLATVIYDDTILPGYLHTGERGVLLLGVVTIHPDVLI